MSDDYTNAPADLEGSDVPVGSCGDEHCEERRGAGTPDSRNFCFYWESRNGRYCLLSKGHEGDHECGWNKLGDTGQPVLD